MLLRIWILLCATLVAGGWILSLFHALNGAGYLAVLAVFAIGVWANANVLGYQEPWHLRRKLRRFLSWKRPLPLLFAAMSAVLLWRGLAIAPFHSDALSYRIPRVLNWIAEGRWYWIDAQDPRLNTRGVNSEWVTVPLLLAWGWDRLIFLPNWVSFLFFPRLIFQVWRDWGVPARMARLWMWLLPASFCYSLQACNASTDILGTFFALAAFALLRRRQRITPADVLCSILGIALATGVKLTIAPIIVPWLILAYARRQWFFKWPGLSFAAGTWAIPLSLIPNVVANLIYAGSITGLSLEPDVLRPAPYLDRFIGNIYLMVLDNLTFPLMGEPAFNAVVEVIPPGPMILQRFEPHSLFLYPFFSVEQEGIGLIVLATGALIFDMAWRGRTGEKQRFRPLRDPLVLTLNASVWALFIAFLWVNTASQEARLISAFYPYLVSTFFVGSTYIRISLRSQAQAIAALGMLAAIFCIITLTNFPLYAIHLRHDEAGRLVKLEREKLWEVVPATEKNIGIMRYWNEWESWAWEPYGSRRVYQLPNNASPSELSRLNIHYVIVTVGFLQAQAETIQEWTTSHHATVEGEVFQRFTKDFAWGCYFVKLDGDGAAVPSPQPPPPAKPTPPS
jgi:hypothetical protein